MKMALLVLSCLMVLSSIAYASKPMPYAGQEQRSIKALSATEIDGLLSGKGMGMAKPAELNHYPGPLHVLEVMNELGLSKTQQLQTRQLFEVMKREAMDLGRQIVAAERRLDQSFSSGDMTDKKLKQQLTSIAQLRGQLRYVHLKTHLQQKALMTAEQVRRYDRLRGYMNHADHHAH
jgi:Spy/CpxP family protein refolding chaperone